MKTVDLTHRKLRSAMTVAQLREALEGYADNAIVLFTCDYGDHYHTQQALPIEEVVLTELDWKIVVESAYSQSGLAVEDIDERDEEVGPSKDFVILR